VNLCYLDRCGYVHNVTEGLTQMVTFHVFLNDKTQTIYRMKPLSFARLGNVARARFVRLGSNPRSNSHALRYAVTVYTVTCRPVREMCCSLTRGNWAGQAVGERLILIVRVRV
jgi:hypothetical protein